MKYRAIRSIMLLMSMIPYVYLAMLDDIRNRSIQGYILIIFAYVVIVNMTIRTNSLHLALLGNAVSFAMSYALVYGTKTERWTYYFKPLSPEMLLIVITSVLVIIQLIFYKKYRGKGINK